MKVGPKQDDFQESVKHARMLGIQIDKDLNFQKHIDNVISDINYRLLVFKKISLTANLKSRLVYGHGILLSKYHFGLICMAGTDKTTFERLERSYNKCLRAIYGRGEGLLTNTEIQKTLKIPSLSEQVDYHCLLYTSDAADE